MLAVKRLIHNANFKSSVGIVLVLVVGLGLLFGLGLVFNASVRVVESGSMCVLHGRSCDGWLSVNSTFKPTLHKGDLIIIQGVDPKEYNTNYPDSDIIVYNRPDNPAETPIVHRIVAVTEIDGKLYFQTKGDGNGHQWPAPVSPNEYDSSWMSGYPDGVPEELVVGRVVMRIPFVGLVTLFFGANSWALPAVIGVILMLVVLQFVVPMLKQKQSKAKAETA